MDPVSQLSQQVSQLPPAYPSVVFKNDEKVSNTPNFDSLLVLLNSNESNDDYKQEIDDKNIENLSVIQLSPIEFNYVNTNELIEALTNVEFWSAVCITSKRCCDAIINAINCSNNNNVIDIWKTNNKKVFVIGDKSSDYLQSKLGWQSIGSHCGSAEMLASFMIDNYKDELTCKPILFPCSQLRRDSLPNMLTKAGMNVNEITVYETIPNRHLGERIAQLNSYITDCLEKSTFNTLKLCFVFFSPSGLSSVYPLLLDLILTDHKIRDKLDVKYIAFGGTTCTALQQLALNVWFTSPKPNPKSLAQALYEKFNIE